MIEARSIHTTKYTYFNLDVYMKIHFVRHRFNDLNVYTAELVGSSSQVPTLKTEKDWNILVSWQVVLS